MTEAKFSQRLRRELRLQLGTQAVIFKHSDSTTGGVPDFSVTFDQHYTTWIEVKLLGNRPENSKLQLETMLRLGRAAYVVWDAERKAGDIFWVIALRKPCCVLSFAGLVEVLIGSYIKAE